MAYPVLKQEPKPMSQGSDLKKPAGHWVSSLVALVLILLVLAGGVYLLKGKAGFGAGETKFTSEWQAIFLTNGQVYFGKVKNLTKDSVYLSDIYYLQVAQQPLQQTQDAEAAPADPKTAEPQLTLIKLGQELHGPKDSMIINRFHVVIMEDLRDDSRVIEAIKGYNSQVQK